MALIDWNHERYTVKVKKFDDQHQELVRLINELHAAMKAGHGRDGLAKLLGALAEYTKVHFSVEEALMASYGYPKLETHRLEHVAFNKRVADFQRQFAAGEAAMTIDVLEFLRGWLIDHILKADREYGPFFAGKNVH
jgi:hemerythrin